MTYAAMRATVNLWPPALYSEWDERAAIIEDGCNVGREESEIRAYEMLKHKAPPVQRELLQVGR